VTRNKGEQDRPLYMISVAAELAGVHPQTLRIYERKRLVAPQRSQGNTRLYSQADVERLRLIQHLTQVEGINLAGVERIIELERELDAMREQLETAVHRMERAEHALRLLRESVRRQQSHGAIVRINCGAVVRREA
jgi:MerR family transcriptional regulator/heat shock protein HspR